MPLRMQGFKHPSDYYRDAAGDYIPFTQNVVFPDPYDALPSVLVGFSGLHLLIEGASSVGVEAYISKITKEDYSFNIQSWTGPKIQSVTVSCFEIPPGYIEFQHGEVEYRPGTSIITKQPSDHTVDTIKFKHPFATPPKVITFFNAFHVSNDGIQTWYFKTYAENITENGFDLHIEPTYNTVLYSLKAGWVAYPSERDNVESSTIPVMASQQTLYNVRRKREAVKTPGEVFVAFNSLSTSNIHSEGNISVPNTELYIKTTATPIPPQNGVLASVSLDTRWYAYPGVSLLYVDK